MNCPMAVLTEETKSSDESKLPSAAFIPFSHPSGLNPNEIENGSAEKSEKYLLSQLFWTKFCLTEIYY
jgi:hypothetical protein